MPENHPPAADPELEHELAQVLRTLEHTYRRRGHPMERAQYLLILELMEGPCSSGELASRLGLDHSTVTRQIAAVEKKGYVAREANPDDGRSTLLSATESGRRTCLEMRDLRITRLGRLLEDWSQEDCQAFTGYLSRMNAALRQRGREK